jgi:hypothetical protein
MGQDKGARFSDLSRPEMWWVFWHPFKAKKALTCTLETLRVTDSIGRTGLIGNDKNGGRLDAFKHAYWMAELSLKIGEAPALKLGEAHEKGNYKTFKKGKLEDGFLPDKPSSEMDLYNNNVGASISKAYTAEDDLIDLVVEACHKGDLRVLKKKGSTFLSCNGQAISKEDLLLKWDNNKCMIPSNH